MALLTDVSVVDKERALRYNRSMSILPCCFSPETESLCREGWMVPTWTCFTFQLVVHLTRNCSPDVHSGLAPGKMPANDDCSSITEGCLCV